MRTDVLNNFIVLADEKSMTIAARKLHISQPTLSRQIAALEEDLGKQLYTRKDGIIKLTQAGRTVYEYACSMVELESRIRTDIAHTAGHITGTVYLGYGDANAMTYIFQTISDVNEKYPNIVFQLIAGDTNTLIDMLGKGSIDFMLECGAKPRGRYNSLSLPGQETIAAIVGKKSKLYNLERATPRDLEGEKLIISRQLFESSVMRDWAGASHGSMKAAVYFNLGMSMFEMAEFGAGCVIAYKELTENYYGGDIRCIPLDPPLYDVCGVVWRKDRVLSKAATVFINTLQDVVSRA